MPFFTVIIPTFNRLGLLRQTLASVWGQEFSGHEVIVVDDGSTDGTAGYLRSLGGRVRVLQQDNRGPGAARNLGAALATGDYLAFLDSDDVWFPWTLETYRQVIEANGHPAFVAGKPLRFHDEAALRTAGRENLQALAFPDYLASGDEWRWWGASSFVIRRATFAAGGGFAAANMNGEDGDLALKLGCANGFVQITAPFTFGYREHGENVTGDFAKSLAGVWHKVRAEQRGGYPGGGARARERWRILTRHLRPVTLECVKRGNRREAWRLYRATFRWHVALGRWKYLAGFPLKALLS